MRTQYFKTFRCMAGRIQFFNPQDEQIFSLKDHIIDTCKSVTIIYDRQWFSVFRIFDPPDNYDIDCRRIRVNYSNGCYILIRP